MKESPLMQEVKRVLPAVFLKPESRDERGFAEAVKITFPLAQPPRLAPEAELRKCLAAITVAIESATEASVQRIDIIVRQPKDPPGYLFGPRSLGNHLFLHFAETLSGMNEGLRRRLWLEYQMYAPQESLVRLFLHLARIRNAAAMNRIAPLMRRMRTGPVLGTHRDKPGVWLMNAAP